MDLAQVVEGHKPRQIEVRLCPDQQLVDELETARQQLKTLRAESQTLDTDRFEQIRSQVAELERQADGKSVTFVMRGIGRAAWKKLQDKYQPTPQQREQFRRQGAILDHNPETFPVAAITASLVEPVGESETDTRRLVQQIWDEWNVGECERLWRACLDANVGVSSLPKRSTVFGTTPSSGPKLDSLPGPESPGPSSTDGGSLAG